MHFANKFIESESRQLALQKGRIVVSEFGTFAPPDPSKGFLGRYTLVSPSLFMSCRALWEGVTMVVQGLADEHDWVWGD